MSNVKEVLRRLVRLNTIADGQNKQILDYISRYLSEYHFELKRIGKCLLASRGQPTLGFIGHTDTVTYGYGWYHDPFTLIEASGLLFGLGACDMKGGIAAMLAAVSLLDKEQALALYFTYDEEISMAGINLIRDRIKEPMVIIGEPTNNMPIYAIKGVLEVRVIFTGVKCHSSTPLKGVSAIERCVDFINQLREYALKLQEKKTTIFTTPYTTVNIGLIKGGESVNSVAGQCEITIDFRIACDSDLAQLKVDLPAMLSSYDARLIIKKCLPPRINKSDISFLEKVAGPKQAKCYLTEGSFIDNDFIILGPGPDTSHEANEHVDVASLEKTVSLYKFIIDHYTRC